MSDMEKIVNEFDKQKIVINGREFIIGKLSIVQLLKLGKSLGKIFARSASELKKLDKESSNVEALTTLFDMLDADELISVLCVLLNTDDKDFVATVPAEDISEIVAVICESNDFNKILKNVQRIGKAVNQEK